MTTWMLVEDEPDLYDMVLAMYDTLGVNGVAFANGEEAHEWINAVDNGHFHDEIPELALIDIRLPGDINGIQIAEQMRLSKILKNTTIILMTAFRVSPKDEKEILKTTQADKLIYKPLPDLFELDTLFHELIYNRKKHI
jgi:CheY-like chemotaxis protein